MEIKSVKMTTTCVVGEEENANATFVIDAEGTEQELRCFGETVSDYADAMCDLQCGDRECVSSTVNCGPVFGGAFYGEDGELVYIEKVVYNKEKRTVAVIWSDGTSTKSTCHEGDNWSNDTGLLIAVMKKLTDSDFTNQLMFDWSAEESDVTVIKTLKQVRRVHNDLDKLVKNK